jgi:putative FmdB family regulatory protein
MPIYEYECEKCGKTFEIFQKMSDKPLTECQICKGKLNKLISQCSFQLKGTGWYVTDYKKPVDTAGRSASSGNGAKNDENVEKTAETKTEAASAGTKTESKTESKTEATTGG